MGSPQASARIMPESLEGVKAQQQGASLTEPRHHQPPAPRTSYPLPQAHARMTLR